MPLKAGPPTISNAKFEFLGNQLDKFDNVTYNIKLYMVSEADMIVNNFESEETVVIADTGVTTRVLIDDLEIKSFIGPGRSNKNRETQRIDFTLREYYGAGLLDQIFIASQQLGIKNYFKAPYFIELTFAGRDPETSSPDIEANALRWVWPIFIKGINTEVDASGSLYSVESYVYGNLAGTDDNGSIPKMMTIKGGTVREALYDLKNQLNVFSKGESVTNISIPDTFDITIHDELGSLKLVDSNITVENAKTSPMESDDRSIRSIPLDANMSILESVNRILSASPEYQAMSKNTETASESEVTDAESTKRLHRVFTDTKIISFDPNRGDYAKLFSFDVQPYEMSTLNVSPSESAANGKKKYSNLKGRRLIQKKYDYLYTGLNDQVIDFDLKFNFGWYVNMPSQAGLFTQHANASEGQHVSNMYYDFQRIQEEISKARLLVANAPEASRTSVASAQTNRIQSEINNSQLSGLEQEQLERLLARSVSPRIPETYPSTYNSNYANAQSTSSNTPDDKKADPTTRFVSDTIVNKKTLTNAYNQFPVSFGESRKNKSDIDGNRNVEGNKGAGRSYVNTMFEQAFSGNSGDLVNVEIEVKGDPYWLESKDGVEAQGSINSRTGQNSIVFTVQTADLPNEESGITEHTSSPFSGVYAVRQVDHKFEKGQFTQTLYAVRDARITASDIAEDLNG